MNRENILWTAHARQKMKFYGLSEQRLRRVLKFPQRIEEGIAPKTTAIMQPQRNDFSQRRAGSGIIKKFTNKGGVEKNRFFGSKNRRGTGEIWLMYQKIQRQKKDKIKIISAWRYPGISPKGKEISIPDDIRKELQRL